MEKEPGGVEGYVAVKGKALLERKQGQTDGAVLLEDSLIGCDDNSQLINHSQERLGS